MTTAQAKETTRDPTDYIAARLEYETTPEELDQMLEHTPNQVFVVDIRGPEEYAAGHIPLARNIPLESLGAAYRELPRNILIVIYCGDISCGLSLLAALELAGTGFRVKRLVGGLADWRQKNFPIEVMPPEPAPEY